MRFVLYTSVISPHQLPLAERIVAKLGCDNYLYVHTEEQTNERLKLGWSGRANSSLIRVLRADTPEAKEWLENADVMLAGDLRPLDLFERRSFKGLKTFYQTERWFKPPVGLFRVCLPSYFRMAYRFVKLLRGNKHFLCLPIGIHAACDIARLCGLFSWDLWCLIRTPELDCERMPGGKIHAKNRRGDNRYAAENMRLWGYYVAPSETQILPSNGVYDKKQSPIRVLWVGRLLNWKRVDVIIKAVGELSMQQKVSLDIYGRGPEEIRLKKIAEKYRGVVQFYPPIPIAEVRRVMREHDVYILSSNAYEGWGAVVSEALEEGMKVVGTYEAGASATLLPNSCLFHAGDWRQLLRILQGDLASCGIGDWSPEYAAKQILQL